MKTPWRKKRKKKTDAEQIHRTRRGMKISKCSKKSIHQTYDVQFLHIALIRTDLFDTTNKKQPLIKV